VKIRIVIDSVTFTVEFISDEVTQAAEPSHEIEPEQTTLSGWVSTGRSPRGPNTGKRSDFKKSHFSSCCGAEGRRALGRLNGHCLDCFWGLTEEQSKEAMS